MCAISSEMLQRLQRIFADVSKSWRCRLVAFGGQADHVHLPVGAHPSMNLARFVGNLKAVSSGSIRQEYAKHLRRFCWKTGFWNNACGVVGAGGHAGIEQLSGVHPGSGDPTVTGWGSAS